MKLTFLFLQNCCLGNFSDGNTIQGYKKWEKVERAFTDTYQDSRRGRNNAAETNNQAEVEINHGERNRTESTTYQDYLDITF